MLYAAMTKGFSAPLIMLQVLEVIREVNAKTKQYLGPNTAKEFTICLMLINLRGDPCVLEFVMCFSIL